MTSRFSATSKLYMLALLLAALLASVLTRPAHAVLRIDVTGGSIQPLPIAVSPFVAANPEATPDGSLAALSAKLSEVIASDLRSSGLFRPIDPRAFTSTVSYANVAAPEFAPWRTIAAQALVTGFMKLNPDGTVLVGCYLFDVLGESEIVRQGFTIPEARLWRRAAHKCADIIYTRLTGEQGYFDSRITFVAETGPAQNRIKRLAVMDQDGANLTYVTNGQNLVLTPRFAPDGQKISYLAYGSRQPQALEVNLASRAQQSIGQFGTMSFSPRYSPDGRKMALSLLRGGTTDIFVYDMATRQLSQLTNQTSIDTAPSFSPDGKRIVFESNRGGSQQLYVMNADGSKPQRISFDAGNPRARYGTPVWSPRGDLIAFTKITDGKFRIGVMRPDGSGERLLTDAWQDEAPAWSPNGRVIIFFRTLKSGRDGLGGGTNLYSVDVTGYNERRIVTPTDASDPSWGPLLP